MHSRLDCGPAPDRLWGHSLRRGDPVAGKPESWPPVSPGCEPQVSCCRTGARQPGSASLLAKPVVTAWLGLSRAGRAAPAGRHHGGRRGLRKAPRT